MSQQLHKNAATDFVDIGAGASAGSGCFAALFLGFMRHAYYIFICEYVYNMKRERERATKRMKERERDRPGIATVYGCMCLAVAGRDFCLFYERHKSLLSGRACNGQKPKGEGEDQGEKQPQAESQAIA